MAAPTQVPARPRRAWLLTIPLLAAVIGVIGGLMSAKRTGQAGAESRPPRPIRLTATEFPATVDGSPITTVVVAPDGQVVVGTATGLVEFRGKDGVPSVARTIKIADAAVLAVAVSRDGSTFAAATDRSVYVASLASSGTGRVIQVFNESDPSTIGSIALDTRGHALAVAEFGVQIFDVRAGRRTAELEQPMPSSGGRGGYEAVAFSADDMAVVASDTDWTDSWRAPVWSLTSTYPCDCNHLARLSPGGRWASYGTSDGHLLLRDPAAGKITRDLTVTATPKAYTGDTAVSDDGGLLFAGSSTGEVLAWRASADAPEGRLKIGTGEVGLLRLDPEGRFMIAGITTETFVPAAHRYEYKLWLIQITST